MMVTSTLKMETARFSETLASVNEFARLLNPREHHQNSHRREKLKSRKMLPSPPRNNVFPTFSPYFFSMHRFIYYRNAFHLLRPQV
jgi:hypothetical protein